MDLEIIRNPVRTSAGHINVEYNHPQFGWIPYTASPDDDQEVSRLIFAACEAGDAGEVAAYVAPERTPDDIRAELTAVVQAHLDAVAAERGYDSMLSLCSYATSTVPRFAAEGQAGVAHRDAVWMACHAVEDAVLAGERAVPTGAELVAELPAMVWPA